MQAFEQYALTIPEILLPAADVRLEKWAVVACDQHTSQPEYWLRAGEIVGDSPSTLHMIYPEAWLKAGDARIASINAAMRNYLSQGVLAKKVRGFVLVERSLAAGRRLGLMAAFDLEAYDHAPGASTPIRATEGTILERIPPRVKIRRQAPIELSHVMMLADDPERLLIEPLYGRRAQMEKLYDFELMLGGGHLRGWLVPEDMHGRIEAALAALSARSQGLLFAVGDGNHSLATARACWLDLRARLPEEERANHPARWALAELVNLHDEALTFEPIHRVLFHVKQSELLGDMAAWLAAHGLTLRSADGGAPTLRALWGGTSRALAIDGLQGVLPLAPVQAFLDEWLAAHPASRIDYVHGAEEAAALAGKDDLGLLLPPMDKRALFPAVRAGGALPRKTFSMGEANEKRYYLECRGIARP